MDGLDFSNTSKSAIRYRMSFIKIVIEQASNAPPLLPSPSHSVTFLPVLHLFACLAGPHRPAWFDIYELPEFCWVAQIPSRWATPITRFAVHFFNQRNLIVYSCPSQVTIFTQNVNKISLKYSFLKANWPI